MAWFVLINMAVISASVADDVTLSNIDDYV